MGQDNDRESLKRLRQIKELTEANMLRTSSKMGIAVKANETLTDPVDRFRVSMPQALIDTDFEYSTQPTKWESITAINGRTFSNYKLETPIAVTAISTTANSRIISITTGTSISAGTPIFVQDATFEGANGLYIAESTGTTFTYTAQYEAPTTGSVLNTGITFLFIGTVYTGAAVTGITYTFSGTEITVTTPIRHHLDIGNEISVVGSNQANANGTWKVTRVTGEQTFVYHCTTTPAGAITGGLYYVRPAGAVLHRAFDGGVKFSSNATSVNEQLVRQTRKYFRYQSGKGIQMSTGSILKPSFSPDAISSSGTTITVNTKEAHNLQYGAEIQVTGCLEVAYNGFFTVTGVISPTRFTYTALSTPPTATASGTYNVAVTKWKGAVTRIGMFDDQNGLFFEFNGETLYAVKRASTYQVSGSITVANNTTTVNAVGAEFSTQLAVGDWIVIKGASYKVTKIPSDNQLHITPSYKGPTISAPANSVLTKTIDTKYAQSTWNLDKFDGTGLSGYNLDLTKMQMFYMDYSWYGAGSIRWGFRATNGSVTYGHKVVNNNVNSEAYMRTGNLPARYEVNTYPPTTMITANVGASDTSLTVKDTTFFPTAGTIKIDSGTTHEYVNYTGKTPTTFTGLTRAKAGEAAASVTIAAGAVQGTVASTANMQVTMRVVSPAFPAGTYIAAILNSTTVVFSKAAFTANPTGVIVYPMGTNTSGSAFTYDVNAPISVELTAPSAAPYISHWGSSVMMDGRFDNDKAYLFTAGTTTTLNVPTAGNRFALLSLRVAPSVSSGLTGPYGTRELINRMQLALEGLEIYAQGNYLVTIVMNGQLSAADTWVSSGGSSLAQVAVHAAGRTLIGGETVGGFYVNSGSTSFGVSKYDLSGIRELGNSILGGGGANTNAQYYPDGPDMLTVMVQSLVTGTSSVFGRLSWTEAQA
jgi:hypothetical protein